MAKRGKSQQGDEALNRLIADQANFLTAQPRPLSARSKKTAAKPVQDETVEERPDFASNDGPIDTFIASVAEALAMSTPGTDAPSKQRKRRRKKVTGEPPLDAIIADAADVLATATPPRAK